MSLFKPTPILKPRKPLRSTRRPIPAHVRNLVFARDSMTCRWCKVKGGALDAHHRLARSQGGKDDERTLISVHRTCHHYIHEHPDEARKRGFIVRSEDEL